MRFPRGGGIAKRVRVGFADQKMIVAAQAVADTLGIQRLNVVGIGLQPRFACSAIARLMES